jgi:hypothetical protein
VGSAVGAALIFSAVRMIDVYPFVLHVRNFLAHLPDPDDLRNIYFEFRGSDPAILKFMDIFEKNPEKYGYEILGGEPFDTFSWKTQHLDNNSAQVLVDKYQHMANPQRTTLDHVSSLTDEQIMIKTPDGKMINTKYSVIENYIAKKMQSTGASQLTVLSNSAK